MAKKIAFVFAASIYFLNFVTCINIIAMKSSYSIGIDIGGTNTDIGLVRNDGVCIARASLSTNTYFEADKYVSDLWVCISNILEANNIQIIDGIGIGAPNANYYTTCIEHAPNLNFKGVVNMKALFSRHTDIPVTMSNDANAAAYGELVYGGAKGMKHFIMVTLGTGVGSGIVIDGRLLHGSTGCAGELGHSILIPDGRQCNCGLCGCMETYCSAGGIRRTAIEMLKADKQYKGDLRQIAESDLTSRDVGVAANQGDTLAIEALRQTGHWLGIALANAVTFSSPEAIFLMGGPLKAGRPLVEPIMESFKKHLLFVFKDSVEIKLSQLPDNDAAILGAAALTKANL